MRKITLTVVLVCALTFTFAAKAGDVPDPCNPRDPAPAGVQCACSDSGCFYQPGGGSSASSEEGSAEWFVIVELLAGMLKPF